MANSKSHRNLRQVGFLGRVDHMIFDFRVVIIVEASYLPTRARFNHLTAEDFRMQNTGCRNHLYCFAPLKSQTYSVFIVEIPFFTLSIKINSKSHFNVEILTSQREGYYSPAR